MSATGLNSIGRQVLIPCRNSSTNKTKSPCAIRSTALKTGLLFFTAFLIVFMLAVQWCLIINDDKNNYHSNGANVNGWHGCNPMTDSSGTMVNLLCLHPGETISTMTQKRTTGNEMKSHNRQRLTSMGTRNHENDESKSKTETTTTTTSSTLLQPSSSTPATNTSSFLSSPPPTKTSSSFELSACLIVMDDNHFLIEWLAYHYHTANLRHLIVTSDPHAQTRPTKILDRWRSYRPDLIIEEWTEQDFSPSRNNHNSSSGQSSVLTGAKTKTVLKNHRNRQKRFNLACLQSLKNQGREWTMMLDIDEYLFVNGNKLSTDKRDHKTSNPFMVPTVLKNWAIPHPVYENINTPCVPIYREQFSAKESPTDVLYHSMCDDDEHNGDDKECHHSNSIVPPGWNPSDFQTLRWRYHGYNQSEQYHMKFGASCKRKRKLPLKVLIDLGRLRDEDLLLDANEGNPHMPLAICRKSIQIERSETPFVAHHYMGTKEQWLYRRGDKRGKLSSCT
jgi:Glycosyl transferase family 2